jgi:glyoxylase-like metal-dependent hydrolase (beta-lactamase superfamily II)/rhodanese-related sulfurtransferase
MDSLTIPVATLRDWLDAGRPVTVLDIRRAADRAEWAIPGSRHLDAYDAVWGRDWQVFDPLALPAGQPVVVVCAAGKTSLRAAEYLRGRGVPALSLQGGMQAWSHAWNTADVPIPDSPARVIQVRRTGKGCLSYLIGAAGEAAVIDAALDPTIYHALAAQRGWRITRVLDTHIHADHLSRSRALAALTGATLYLPAQERVAYPFQAVRDGDTVAVGPARLTALHTPGHTRESTCYRLDSGALFTGDTLYLAAVGRPDLEADATETQARARALYGSLQRLFGLPGTIAILPGHTSAPIAFDGQPLVAPLAEVRVRLGAALDSEAAFLQRVLAHLPPTPPNHGQIVGYNEAGELPAGDLSELEAGANRCAAG